MKKKSIIAVILMSMLVFVGCGGSTEKDNTSDNSSSANTETKGYVMTVQGTDVAVNAPMAPIVDALGEADKYFESESCAFQGLDKVYTYGSVVITTYPEDGKDYVYSIELKDDTVTTKEGAYIGMAKADVVSAYGNATNETEVALVYEKDACQLAFILEDGLVKNITYTAITE